MFKMTRQHGIVLTLVVFSTIVRMAASYLMAPKPINTTGDALIEKYVDDEKQYLSLGKSIAEQGEFSSTYVRPAERAPGWPAVLGLWFNAFGINESFRILLIILGTLICIETYVLTKLLFNDPITSLIALAISSVWTQYITYSSMAMSDNLYVCLLLGSYILMVRMIEGFNWWRVLILSILVSASIYVRPQGAIYVVLGSVGIYYLAGINGNKINIFSKLAAVCMFGIICAISLAPWIYHNYLNTGRISPMVENDVFFQNNNPTYKNWSFLDKRLFGHSQPPGDSEEKNMALSQCLERQRVEDPENHFDQRYPCYQEIAWNFVKEYPVEAIKLSISRFIKHLMPAPFGVSTKHWWALTLAWLFVFPGAVLFIFSRKSALKVRLLIAIPAIVELLIGVGLATEIRYRLPVEMIFIVAAAAVWANIKIIRRLLIKLITVDDTNMQIPGKD